MAALGSLYIYIEGDNFIETKEKPEAPKPGSLHSEQSDAASRAGDHSMDEPSSLAHGTRLPEMIYRASHESNILQPVVTVTRATDEQMAAQHIENIADGTTVNGTAITKSTAGRFRIRKWLDTASAHMKETAHEELDRQGHKDKKAYKYPMLPGEQLRNSNFYETSDQFMELRLQRVASSATSIRSLNVSSNGEGPSTPPVARMRPRTNTDEDAITPLPRRPTLEVPADIHRSPKLGHHQGWA
jgi:hypothetical protein